MFLIITKDNCLSSKKTLSLFNRSEVVFKEINVSSNFITTEDYDFIKKNLPNQDPSVLVRKSANYFLDNKIDFKNINSIELKRLVCYHFDKIGSFPVVFKIDDNGKLCNYLIGYSEKIINLLINGNSLENKYFDVNKWYGDDYCCFLCKKEKFIIDINKKEAIDDINNELAIDHLNRLKNHLNSSNDKESLPKKHRSVLEDIKLAKETISKKIEKIDVIFSKNKNQHNNLQKNNDDSIKANVSNDKITSSDSINQNNQTIEFQKNLLEEENKHKKLNELLEIEKKKISKNSIKNLNSIVDNGSKDSVLLNINIKSINYDQIQTNLNQKEINEYINDIKNKQKVEQKIKNDHKYDEMMYKIDNFNSLIKNGINKKIKNNQKTKKIIDKNNFDFEIFYLEDDVSYDDQSSDFFIYEDNLLKKKMDNKLNLKKESNTNVNNKVCQEFEFNDDFDDFIIYGETNNHVFLEDDFSKYLENSKNIDFSNNDEPENIDLYKKKYPNEKNNFKIKDDSEYFMRPNNNLINKKNEINSNEDLIKYDYDDEFLIPNDYQENLIILKKDANNKNKPSKLDINISRQTKIIDDTKINNNEFFKKTVAKKINKKDFEFFGDDGFLEANEYVITKKSITKKVGKIKVDENIPKEETFDLEPNLENKTINSDEIIYNLSLIDNFIDDYYEQQILHFDYYLDELDNNKINASSKIDIEFYDDLNTDAREELISNDEEYIEIDYTKNDDFIEIINDEDGVVNNNDNIEIINDESNIRIENQSNFNENNITRNSVKKDIPEANKHYSYHKYSKLMEWKAFYNLSDEEISQQENFDQQPIADREINDQKI